ncbi:MAG: DegT/DnrJ/EryC1/StrS family aminotransferase [Verrucomicrobiota bacterium]|nr:DegT/DnrJ/EryC1/StrS family aminotransferase [Verrucomicrobiota bacterium]MEE2813169.1 DegT/DnrJ/EryC1/StrS family aminotransferase [Verrucomicrobiota bacterium]
MERIPIAGPSISQREIDYVTDAATTGWYDGAGEYPHRFERAFASYLEVKHAVSLPSCTSGLHLALAALGIGPGDEVIVPDVTWIASAAPISYVGAVAVFADIDERTWCLSSQSVRECITEKTKAILAVDLYGGIADYAELRLLAEEHGLKIIEDAAEAFGSEYEGCKAGTLGDVAAFSFHGSKTMSTGEGGMLVTDDDELYARVMQLRDHGREPGDVLFRNTEVAFKYKMPPVSAAIGLGQVERAEELVVQKREIFNWYHEALSEVNGVQLNHEPDNTKNSYWMVTAVLDPKLGWPKEKLMGALDKEGIDSRPMFYPLSSLSAYDGVFQSAMARDRNEVSYRITPWGINLPSALCLKKGQVQRVVDALIQILSAP